MNSQQQRTLNQRTRMDTTAGRVPASVRWSLYIFLFSVCFENFDPLGISSSFTLSKLAGMIFAAFCFWKLPSMMAKQHWTVKTIGWMLLFLALVTGIAEMFQPVPRSAFGGVIFSFAQCILLYWLCVNVMRDRRVAVYGLLSFSVSAALLCVLMKLGIGREVVRDSAEFERASFLGANANLIAIWAATGMVIIVGLVMGNPLRFGTWRYWLLAFIAPMLLVISESGSRGAAISLVLGMACYLVTIGSLQKRLLIAMAAACVCVGLYYVSRGGVLEFRMHRTVEYGSMAGREMLWPAAVKMIGQKPFFGWGMWNPEDYNEMPSMHLGALQGNDPHNGYLAFFVFGGMVAGIPFLCMSGWWIYQSFLARRGPWGALPLAITVFMLSTMFKAGGFYVTKILWIALAFATAASLPHAKPKKRRRRLKAHKAASSQSQAVELLPEQPLAGAQSFGVSEASVSVRE